MTVENEISKVAYDADGVQTEFAYTFRLDATSDMQVFFDEVEQVGGFTVFLANDVGGPRVVFAPDPPPALTSVTLLRFLPLDQQADYVPFDKFPAESHEQALDKLTMLVQQLQEELSRTTQIGQGGDPTVDYTLPPYDAGKGWMWSEGDPKRIVNTDDTLNGILALVTAQADAAAASASAAATSASNASNSEGLASAAAAAAAISETNSAASESNAATSESNAAASAVLAAASESNADGSATAAAASAAAASTSEGNASVSEGNASTSAAAAAVSASDASNSEAAAASSASGAAISESNALASATAAQQSADDALAAANAAMGWDISIVHNGPLVDDAKTRVIVSRGLKWVLDTPAIGFLATPTTGQTDIEFYRYSANGAELEQIGFLRFATGVNAGTWTAVAAADVTFSPGEMVGANMPAAVNGAADFSSVLPLAIDITVLAAPPGQFDILLPATRILNYNVRAAINALGYAGDIPAVITIAAQAGTIIGSASYGMPSFRTGSFFAGSTILLVNNGKIQGAGGGGGSGAPQGGAPGAGQAGDQAGAVMLDWDLSIDNTNGSIWAGGGGGGGGDATNTQFETGAGGGGGQGIPGGPGGPQGESGGGGAGVNGAEFSAGSGGLPFEPPDRGRGGDGGVSGIAGQAGYDSSGGPGAGGAGGAGGRAINLQGNTYTDLGAGDTQGPVS